MIVYFNKVIANENVLSNKRGELDSQFLFLCVCQI